MQQLIARDGWVDELNGWFNEGLKHSAQNYHSSGYVINFATECPPSIPILSVEKTGSGTVTTDQFSCGSDCATNYELNEEVTLVATPADGSVFSVWGGDCQGVEPTTTVVMDDHKMCVAHFYETSSGTCDGVTDIPSIECEALISLYHQTGGKGWTNQQGWLSDALANNWHGITVEAGHVTVVNLAQNGLIGMIPEPICNLSQLRKLSLGKYGYDSTNHLIGKIPSCLGDLAALEQLNLPSNELTGEIPTELGQATQLTHLDLTDNPLEGQFPEALCQLTSLEELKVGILLGKTESRNIQLIGSIPECIGEKLLNLKVLGISHAAFSGHLPSSLCNLTELTIIRFQYNRLLTGEIPSCFDKLKNLVSLQLYVNKLTGVFPETLCNLTNLTNLAIQNNRFNGEIPSCLENLSKLTLLGLYENKFEGNIPAQVCQLNKLRYLYLGSNSFTGEVPECIGDLTDLRYLYLHSLPITKIPSSFGNLTNLSRLYFHSSQLREVIPESLINLAFSNPKFTRLTLANNNLGTENCRQMKMLKSRGQWDQDTTFSPQRDGFDFEVDCDSYNQYILSVAKAGEGSGTVTGPGIQCDNDCVDAYDPDTEITLTAQADSGSRFVSWSGDCQGTSRQTTVTLEADKSCVAQFATQETPTSDCSGEAATYSNQTRQAHLPGVEIPFYTDVTGQPVEAALVGLYSAILEISFGFSDFEIKELNFLKIKDNETHLAARFEPQTNQLDIPTISLETVSPFQAGEPGLPLQCQVRLQRSVLRPEVLMLENFDCQQP